MKICQINCVYGIGSTGKIVRDLHIGLLEKGYESYVLCPINKEYPNDKNVFTTSNLLLNKLSAIYRRTTGNQYDGAFLQTNRLIKELKNLKPDIVHLQCINGNNINIYRLLKYLKKNKIKTVLTLHAEFMYTGGCGHAYDCEKWKKGCGKCSIRKEATQSVVFDRTARTWKKMRKSLNDFNDLIVVSVSPWLMNRAKQSPFLNNKKHYYIFNGLETVIFKNTLVNDIREKFAPSGEKIIFHATPAFSDSPNHIKGGRYVIELAKRLNNDNVKILVAGNYNLSSLVPNNLILLGRIADQNLLAKYYSAADITLLTSKRETFSMVTSESLCCGTKVVGFKAGGPEAIALKEYSEFVEYDDIDSLENKIRQVLFQDVNYNKNDISQAAHSIYSKEVMLNEYLNIYNSLDN